MPITLITGPANAGKAELVIDALRRHLAHGAEPLLVVPTRADQEHYLRELAGGAAAMGVTVTRFAGLIEELVRRAGVAEPVLDGLGREQLIAALARRRAGGSRHDGRGLPRALGELFAELQVRRVSPARFAGALRDGLGESGAAALGADLGGLYGEYRAALERIGRLDPEQRAVRALDALRERPALWHGAPVLLYGFDDLTRLQLDAIETLGRLLDADVTVSLAYEPGRVAFAGRAASFHELAPLAAEHRALPARSQHYAPASRPALAHLERSLFEPRARRVPASAAVRLLSAAGPRAELELVAREIRGLLDAGLGPEETAVLVRDPGGSAELVREVFTAAGVPYALSRSRPFADTAVGRALTRLLRCVPAPDGPAPGSAADLLAWLRAPGLLQRPELADALEIALRRRGAEDAVTARALWEEGNWHLDAIDRLAEAQRQGPAALVERAGRELQRLFSAPRLGLASVLGPEELDEARALAAGRGALARLRELARLERRAAPASAAEVAGVLEGVALDSGELPGFGAVAVLDPLELRARRVRALFVTGMQEGAFPRRARPQPLLGEQERARVASASGLALDAPEDMLAAERYLLYAVLSRPEELLVLSWHEADEEGQPVPRSLFVEDVCDLFDGGPEPLRAPARPVSERPAARPAPGGDLHDERLLAALRERVWSASSLERWVRCPVAWFVERLLRPGAFEPDPEPLARGGLAHAALRDTFEGLRRETGSARVSPANLERARALLERALAENEPAHPLSVSPERRSAVRRRLHADLRRFLEYAAERGPALEPSEFELGFGFSGEDEAGEASALGPLELGGGVRLRGRIDRIDTGAGGEALVVDYKSSAAPPAARWSREGQLQVALYMLAAEQLLGLRVVGGLYQPLSGDLQPRGAVSSEAVAQVPSTRTDVREPDELRELLEQARREALAAAGEAARGELRPRPASCAFRGGCMYPTICRCER